MVGIAYVCHFFTAFYMLIKWGFGYKFSRFLGDILPDLIVLLGMELAVIIYPFDIQNSFVSLLVKTGFLAISFIILLWITGEYKLIRQVVKRK